MFEFFLATLVLTHANQYKPAIYAPFKDAASCATAVKEFAAKNASDLVEAAAEIQTRELLRTGTDPGTLKVSVVCLKIVK